MNYSSIQTHSYILGLLALATISQTALGQVATTASEAKPLKVGDKVPDGVVRTLEGKEIKFRSTLKGSKTVVVFYRGSWCPFCNRQLAELEGIKGELKELGYQIIAISPDVPERLKEATDKNKLDFTLLSDSKSELLQKFGVAFRIDDGTYNLYREKYQLDWNSEAAKSTTFCQYQPCTSSTNRARSRLFISTLTTKLD